MAQSFTSAVIVGSNGGLGSAIARRLLALNPHLQLAAVSRKGSMIPNLGDEYKNRVLPIKCDVTDDEQVYAAAQFVKSNFNSCELVFNATGLLHSESLNLKPEKSVRQVTPENFERLFQINAYAVAYLGKHFLPIMKDTKNRDPKIFASISARVGSIEDNNAGGWIAYRAAKSAQNQMLQCMALEYSRQNIAFVALQPGTVQTELSAPFWRKDGLSVF